MFLLIVNYESGDSLTKKKRTNNDINVFSIINAGLLQLISYADESAVML